MKVHGWRIVPERRRDAAFTGEGARRYGARWNSPGRPVVYLSEHRSLAMLEVLVQRRAFQELAQRFLLFEATWEEQLMERAGPGGKQLPRQPSSSGFRPDHARDTRPVQL